MGDDLAMIELLQSLLNATVTIEAYKSQDRYGQATLGDTVTIRARIEQGMHEAVGQNGQTLIGRYKVILGAPIQVDPRDTIMLPKAYGVRNAEGAFEAISPPIVEVRPVYVNDRHDHTVIICG